MRPGQRQYTTVTTSSASGKLWLASGRQLLRSRWARLSQYLTDADGIVTDTYTYDAFGNLLERTGTTANDYLYAASVLTRTRLVLLRARHMSPATGRFFTQDTFEGVAHDPTSLHKYLYANANPVNRIDPSGNFGFSIGGFAISFSIQSILVNMVSAPSLERCWVRLTPFGCAECQRGRDSGRVYSEQSRPVCWHIHYPRDLGGCRHGPLGGRRLPGANG